MTSVLITIGLAIIFTLAAIAIYYLLKLRRVRARILKIRHEQQTAIEKNISKTSNDIEFLARAYLADQADLNEVSLRIHNLLNHLGLEQHQRQPYTPFDQVAMALKEVPTHANWKALSKDEREDYRKQFQLLEKEHRKAALLSAENIVKNGIKAMFH